MSSIFVFDPIRIQKTEKTLQNNHKVVEESVHPVRVTETIGMMVAELVGFTQVQSF